MKRPGISWLALTSTLVFLLLSFAACSDDEATPVLPASSSQGTLASSSQAVSTSSAAASSSAVSSSAAASSSAVSSSVAASSSATSSSMATSSSSSALASWTITYQLDGGENNAGNPASYTSSDLPLSFLAPTKTSYVFDGWFFDESRQNLVTTLTNGTTGNLVLYAKWTQMRSGLSFNGTTHYVNVPSGSALNGTANGITLEAWIRAVDPSKNQKVYAKFGWSDQSGYILGITDGKLYPEFFLYNGTGRAQYTKTAGTIPANKWTHVAVTWLPGDEGEIKSYVNGVLVATIDAAGTSWSSCSTALTIGQWGSMYYGGLLDEVRIWSKARSQSEIQADMNSELAGTESNLTAYYKVNETSGTTLTDSAGADNNGTLTGGMTGGEWTSSN